MEESETQAPAAEAAQAPKPKSTPMAVDGGALVPTNANELMSVITSVAAGGGFPDCFDTKEKRIAAYNLAHALMKEDWQLALNHMGFVKGKLCIYGELPGTLAHRTGDVENWKLFVIDPDYKEICTANKNLEAPLYAGVLRVKRKGQEQCEYFYTVQEARTAGQLPAMKWDKGTRQMVPNPDSPWEKYLKIMLMRKAQAQGVNFQFPEAKCGVPIAEYDFDEAPDLIKDVTPQPTRAARATDLNSRFAGAATEQ